MLLIMFSFNQINKSLSLSTLHFPTTSSIHRFLYTNKQEKTRQDLLNTVTISSLISNTTSFSSSTSTTEYQQISFDESYSVKTGIKTAVLLGGMLLLVVVYLCWKARSRLCNFSRFSSSNLGNSHLSSAKFDLDYWLKQVDILDAKEAERNRENLSPYLELPLEEPRDNELATATWIVDAHRQRRLIQYQQQQQLLQQRTTQPNESNPLVYRRRRRRMFQRVIRRFLIPSRQQPSFLIEYSRSLVTDMRPSIVNNSLIPPPETLDIQPRRVASWPRLKSTHQQNDTMSALQTHNARKRLLKRPSRTTTFDI